MWSKINCWVDFLANWFEVIGFGIAIFTAIKVLFLNRDIKNLNTKHLYQTRINEHLSDLLKAKLEIVKLNANFDINVRDIRLQVSECLVHCESIQSKIVDFELKSLPTLISKLKKAKARKYNRIEQLTFIDRLIRTKPLSSEHIDLIYIELNALITEIENINKDHSNRL